MLYLLALICPPAALFASHRRWQGMLALVLCIVGFAWLDLVVGLIVLAGCILWAVHVVDDDRAAAVSARFIQTVKPIRTIRD